MVAAYLAGEQPGQLSKRFCIGDESVKHYVIRAGYEPRCNRVFSKMTNEQRAAVVADYHSGLNSEELAAKYGGQVSSVLRFLRRGGTVMRTQSEACRQYSFDPLAFETPSPERSYFFGLLLADGCITRGTSSRHVVLVLTQSDMALVEDFRSFLRSEHPIPIIQPSVSSKKNARPSARLCIASDVLSDSLEYLGIAERKSKFAFMPEQFAYDPDAWRGYVDGDGWVTVSRERLRPIIGVCGSAKLCEQFSDFGKSLSIGTCAHHPNSSIRSAQYIGRKAVAMIRHLYGRPGTSLRRKQITAHAILASFWGDDILWGNTPFPKARFHRPSPK